MATVVPRRIEDRYELEEGTVLLTGVQAAIRIAFDQMRIDRLQGTRTAAMISGYPGSPLGGLDLELARQKEHAEELRILHRPGLNEDLAATTVWGTQQVPNLPGPRVDGVLGVWYGKAPGVDRSGDALRHGSLGGAHSHGGLLALCGDDPHCKSSTIPSASERSLAAFGMPVLAPGNPQEVLDFGLHAVAMSRMSGTWPALKIASNVADAVATVRVRPEGVAPVEVTIEDRGAVFEHKPTAFFAPPGSLELERTLRGPRQLVVREYARVNRLNRIVTDSADARIGLVAAGTAYFELREGLAMLGLDEDRLERLGVRILKLGLIWPLEPTVVREFADGLEEIFVVEEKGPFVESAFREILYGSARPPRIVGNLDEQGTPLVPAHGALTPDLIATIVGRRLSDRFLDPELEESVAALERPRELSAGENPPRIPFFCSGCPHNRSTDVPDGTLVSAGIGCHTMIALSPKGKGNITGLTQMGGEGAQWFGQEPFVEADHIVQNLGDGTLHHSASLAIRAATASGVNITYKILYNSFISMTGGQVPQGQLQVPELTRWLEIEGVKRIIVTTEDPARYRGRKLAPIAELRGRDDLVAVQEELAGVKGVTVHIHDQACAAELRRLRKRGKAPEPAKRAFINRRVCEGCGDCGRKSHCLSVIPVETEFGTKTDIHQPSCNKDFSCLDGDCPSFLEVIPGTKAKVTAPDPPAGMPEPKFGRGDETTLRLIGIGGTGVVTVAQVLAMAAMLDGKRTLGLDQTGLAQKGGTVTSDVRLVPDDEDRASRPGREGIDLLLGFDLVASTSQASLEAASPNRTVAVLSTTELPTAEMIGNPDVRFGRLSETLEAVEGMTKAESNLYVDAQVLAETIFGDHMPANTLLVGAAWQLGHIPISLASIEEAYRLNGAAVEKNLAAFHWGRAVVADPDAIDALTAASEIPVEDRLSPEASAILEGVGADPDSELFELLRVRIPELVGYQSPRYAQRYADVVTRVLDAERAGDPAAEEAAVAVAQQLYRLMSYKDEYEVARLHLDPEERARLKAEFGPDAKVKYLLHPPLLRALGMKHKIALGRWFDPMFRLLRSMKRLRGTAFDPFGHAKVRRVERQLIEEYVTAVDEALPALATRHGDVVALLELPAQIRGYEEVKLDSVDAYRQELSAGLAALAGPTPAA